VQLFCHSSVSNMHLIIALHFEFTCGKQICINVPGNYSALAECADNAHILNSAYFYNPGFVPIYYITVTLSVLCPFLPCRVSHIASLSSNVSHIEWSKSYVLSTLCAVLDWTDHH